MVDSSKLSKGELFLLPSIRKINGDRMDEEKIKRFYKKKEELEQLQDILTKRRECFEAENFSLTQSISVIKDSIDELKTEITEEAEREYEATGNKKLYGGVGIREVTKIAYDKDEATEWAKKHDLCMTLDVKEFEKLAKTQNFEFVNVSTLAQVTFAPKFKE